jgi:hypothetical protein
MKKMSTALLAAGLMALSACGGGSENKAANTVVEDVNLVEDNLADENLLGTDTLGNEAGNGVETNAAENGASNSAG